MLLAESVESIEVSTIVLLGLELAEEVLEEHGVFEVELGEVEVVGLDVGEQSQQVLVVVELVEVGTDVVDGRRESILELLLVCGLSFGLLSHFFADLRASSRELAVDELRRVDDLAELVADPVYCLQGVERIRVVPVRLGS